MSIINLNKVAKGEKPIEKNVIVTDESNNPVGSTYPKRARGLVKNGRAVYVGGCENGTPLTIRLNKNCPTNIILEDNLMENKIYFNAREWYALAEECREQVSSRTFITGVDGKLTEVYMLGDWNWHWSEISSKALRLEKNTEYTFTFWLNGGENDNSNETCQLSVLYTDSENLTYDRAAEYVYKLNRNVIKPLKKYNGWELYSIPFTTEDKLFTRLKFIALAAPMAVMTADDIESYTELPDTPDEFEAIRPQRHNIVFSDGFPTNKWYSTQNLRLNTNGNNFHPDGNNQNFNQPQKNGAHPSNESSGIGMLMFTISQKIKETDLGDVDARVIDSLTNMISVATGLAPFAG